MVRCSSRQAARDRGFHPSHMMHPHAPWNSAGPPHPPTLDRGHWHVRNVVLLPIPHRQTPTTQPGVGGGGGRLSVCYKLQSGFCRLENMHALQHLLLATLALRELSRVRKSTMRPTEGSKGWPRRPRRLQEVPKISQTKKRPKAGRWNGNSLLK